MDYRSRSQTVTKRAVRNHLIGLDRLCRITHKNIGPARKPFQAPHSTAQTSENGTITTHSPMPRSGSPETKPSRPVRQARPMSIPPTRKRSRLKMRSVPSRNGACRFTAIKRSAIHIRAKPLLMPTNMADIGARPPTASSIAELNRLKDAAAIAARVYGFLRSTFTHPKAPASPAISGSPLAGWPCLAWLSSPGRRTSPWFWAFP
jgi:hypothetical protein